MLSEERSERRWPRDFGVARPSRAPTRATEVATASAGGRPS